MPTYADRQIVPFSPVQMFDLVADVGRYPEFLPWCTGAHVRSREHVRTREAELLVADLAVGFGPIRERFTSRVILQTPRRIRVTYQDGPFHYLNNQWLFTADTDGTRIDFWVDFEFRNRMLQRAMGLVFNEAVRRMVGAFLQRAKDVYDDAASPADPQAAALPGVTQ